jgi:hypothetical protein
MRRIAGRQIRRRRQLPQRNPSLQSVCPALWAGSRHVRLVYGVQSLPIGAPVIVDTIFEIEPSRISTSKQ